MVDRLMFHIHLSMETVHLASFWNASMEKLGTYSGLGQFRRKHKIKIWQVFKNR